MIAAPQAPPWWGVAVITASATLLGVLVTQWFNRLSAESHRKHDDETRNQTHAREDAQRWHDDVWHTAARFAGATSAYSRDMQSWLRNGDYEHPELKPTFFDAMNAMQELAFIAPQQVNEAAEVYFANMLGVTWHDPAEGMVELRRLQRDERTARHDFINAVRDHLGQPPLTPIPLE